MFIVWRICTLYLTHESKDAIAKIKLNILKDIKLINNFDIERYVTLDVEDKEDMLNDVCDMIDDYDLANMRELRRFVKKMEQNIIYLV